MVPALKSSMVLHSIFISLFISLLLYSSYHFRDSWRSRKKHMFYSVLRITFYPYITCVCVCVSVRIYPERIWFFLLYLAAQFKKGHYLRQRQSGWGSLLGMCSFQKGFDINSAPIGSDFIYQLIKSTESQSSDQTLNLNVVVQNVVFMRLEEDIWACSWTISFDDPFVL